jgi:hypothetical protein
MPALVSYTLFEPVRFGDASTVNAQLNRFGVVTFVLQGCPSGQLQRCVIRIFLSVTIAADNFFTYSDSKQPLVFAGVPRGLNLICTHKNLPKLQNNYIKGVS